VVCEPYPQHELACVALHLLLAELVAVLICAVLVWGCTAYGSYFWALLSAALSTPPCCCCCRRCCCCCCCCRRCCCCCCCCCCWSLLECMPITHSQSAVWHCCSMRSCWLLTPGIFNKAFALYCLAAPPLGGGTPTRHRHPTTIATTTAPEAI
jgi:hypothetical protein